MLSVHHIKCDSRSQVVRKSVPVIVNICPHPSLDLQTSQPQSPPPPPDNVGITSTYLCLPSLLTNNTRVTEFFFSVKCFNRKSLSLSAVDSQQKVVFIIIMMEKMGNLCLVHQHQLQLFPLHCDNSHNISYF